MSFLPKVINICKKCGSTDLFRKKTDFSYRKGWGFYGPLKKRMIVNICNTCGNENTTLMQQGLYEIYRRLLKEKTPATTVTGVLICPQCGSEALLEQIKLLPHEIRAVLYCKQDHRSIVILPEQEKSQWIGSILSGIKICINCWSPNQRVWIIQPHDFTGNVLFDTKVRKSRITLQCPDCEKKRTITINNVVYDEFMDFLFS
ncbi:MAG: hypothetical protein HWN67_04005 [Candidatus Helarchaeota archaeon]|nr:hypothetical protein [Candidatus Helarchaeota archaeon]